MSINEVNEVAVTITIAQNPNGTIRAGLYEAQVPPDEVMPILEVAGALDAAIAVEVLLHAAANAQLINLPDGGEPR